MSLRIGVNSSLARNLKYKQIVWKADGLVESTLLSQKIKAISERLRFKLSVFHI